MSAGRRLLSAAEAASTLGVKPATLYAYVSRGLLKAQRRAGARGSWFDPGDVDRLASRGRAHAPPGREVRIESAVTAIEGGRYFYRGRDPLVLARTARFEQVAELLWTGALPPDPVWTPSPAAIKVGRAVQRLLRPDTLPFDRIRIVTAVLSAADPFRHDLRPHAVAAAIGGLLPTLVESLARRSGGPSGERPRFAARLWSRLATRAPTAAELDVLDAALVLLADHELAASTFAVRIAAALRADPYGVLSAGFGVLGGAWHGAVSAAAEALLLEIDAAGSVASVIDRHLRRGEKLPGIGHPLYPDGDPRGRALLEHVSAIARDRKRMRQVDTFLTVARARGLPPPNVDLGIAAMTHVLGFPLGTGELIFALARIAGWTAHAIEEYEHPSALRPRAVYVGVRPGDAAED
jgi:citrate synthase